MKNPDVKFPVDFDVYDPKISTDLKNTDAGVSGTRTVEYTIIPRRAGEFTIPSVEFSYFDFSTNRYKTLATPEYHLTVEQGNTSEGSVVLANFSGPRSRKASQSGYTLYQDGRFASEESESFFYGSWTYRLCYLVPAFAGLHLFCSIIGKPARMQMPHVSKLRKPIRWRYGV